MNHSDEQIPLLTMQIEYTNLGLESSYVYLAIYVLQIVVEKLLLTFLCKKPHTLKYGFCKKSLRKNPYFNPNQCGLFGQLRRRGGGV